MLQKLSLYAAMILGIFFMTPTFAAECDQNWEGNVDVGNALVDCIHGSDVVHSGGDFSVEGNFKTKISAWTRAIASFLSLLAVGAIVYGAFLMTISGGDDEKIKKGKDIVKWSIVGFLGVVTAGGLISILVNFIFAIG